MIRLRLVSRAVWRAVGLQRVAAGLLCVATIGCDLTRVSAPDLVQPPDLENPPGAAALYSGALMLLAQAFNGGPLTNANSAVVASGLLTDELGNASGSALQVGLDSRSIDDGGTLGSTSYTALQQARVQSLAAAQVIAPVAPQPSSRIGHLFAVTAYSELLLGEIFCAGIPLADVQAGAPVAYGSSLTSEQLFERALSDFDSAASYAADSVRILNLARVGRGRTLVNLGRFAEAAAAVSSLPTAYTYVTEHTTAVQPNALSASFTSGAITVSDVDGGNGLNYRSAGDPRVKAAFLRLGNDGVTGVWALTTLGAGQATPTVLASGIEARLIEAEAALQADPNDTASTGSGWLGILNALRSTAISPAMTALADPGSPAARVDLLFRERAFWLYGTAHRQGDLRRLSRQYGRSIESVWPTGAYRSGVYGTSVTMVPNLIQEGANPNYQGCLDRNP
ncbi:MAG TPA: hypothetical protein VGQ25_08040 [Gemmatimonadales bacterium]|nr:hypothetical protein [Gemmatimonadales bacterium]